MERSEKQGTSQVSRRSVEMARHEEIRKEIRENMYSVSEGDMTVFLLMVNELKNLRKAETDALLQMVNELHEIRNELNSIKKRLTSDVI